MPPEGIFGMPHGLLSSRDEWIALAIGVVAVLAAVLYDGDLDLGPVRVAAAIGVAVSLGLSFVAPPAVANEWHVPVVVVLVVVGGGYVLVRR